MANHDLWKYCTAEHCKEYLLDLELLDRSVWSDSAYIARLYAISNHTSDYYSKCSIPRRTGGLRTLMIPNSLLKSIQRRILHHILNDIPVSDYAFAYCKGRSPVDNAIVHSSKKQILKLDISHFFDHILFPMVYNTVFTGTCYPPSVRYILTSLCCYNNRLPQGAPASAAISNIIMKPFDAYMGAWCEERNITYSRYCDDMTFSGDFNQTDVQRKVRGFLQSMGFELNHSKTRLLTIHQQQMVTGIIVNQKPQVSAAYRRALRQELYYCRKYGVTSHLQKTGDTIYLPAGEQGIQKYIQTLLGKVSYVLLVNPEDSYFQNAKLILTESAQSGLLFSREDTPAF